MNAGRAFYPLRDRRGVAAERVFVILAVAWLSGIRAYASVMPISARVDYFSSEVKYYDGRPEASLSSFSAGYNMMQNFYFPDGGANMTISGSERETLVEGNDAASSHVGISMSSLKDGNTFSSGYNEVKTVSRSGVASLDNTSENFFFTMNLDEGRLPPMQFSYNSARNQSSTTSSFAFNASHSFTSTGVNIGQFEINSENPDRTVNKTVRSVLDITDFRTLGSGLRVSNTLGIERFDTKSAVPATGPVFSRGDITRLTSNVKYTGLDKVTLMSDFNLFDQIQTISTQKTGEKKSGEKYHTYTLVSVVRVSDDSSLIISHTSNNRREPEPQKDTSDAEVISYTKSLRRDTTIAMSHSRQKARSSDPAGAGKPSETNSISLNSYINEDIGINANIMETDGRENMNLKAQFYPVRSAPADYYYSRSENFEMHDAGASIYLKSDVNVSLRHTLKKEGGVRGRALTYSFSGRLRNNVGFSVSAREERDQAAGRQTSTSAYITFPISKKGAVDMSVNTAKNSTSSSLSASIGCSASY